MLKKIAIFGGTFDPIHLGHLHVAHEIKKIDDIIFIPTNNPPHKRNKKITPFEIRYKWISKSISEYSNYYVSKIEFEKKFSYSIDLIKSLSVSYKDEAELYFIMGSDMSLTFSTWKNYKKILELITPIVLVRKDHPSFIDEGLNAEEKIVFKNAYVELDTLLISSTEIRNNINDIELLKEKIHPVILEEIKEYYK